MPITKPLVRKKLKPRIPFPESSDNFHQIWLSNLHFSCPINHWPKSWRLPVDILILHSFMFWGLVWLTSFLFFLLLEYRNNKLLGIWGSGNFWLSLNTELRYKCFLKKLWICCEYYWSKKKNLQRSFAQSQVPAVGLWGLCQGNSIHPANSILEASWAQPHAVEIPGRHSWFTKDKLIPYGMSVSTRGNNWIAKYSISITYWVVWWCHKYSEWKEKELDKGPPK